MFARSTHITHHSPSNDHVGLLSRVPQAEHTRNTRKGLSLLEVAISTILVSMLIVASLNTVAGTSATYLQAATNADARGLAELLLQEIMQRPFADATSPNNFGLEAGESGTNRLLFDDVDDYAGYSQTNPTDKSGQALTLHAGWTWTVIVDYVAPATPHIASGPATVLKRIRVTVRDPRQSTLTVGGYRTAAGAIETNDIVTRTVTGDVQVQVTLPTGEQLLRAAPLPNRLEVGP